MGELRYVNFPEWKSVMEMVIDRLSQEMELSKSLAEGEKDPVAKVKYMSVAKAMPGMIEANQKILAAAEKEMEMRTKADLKIKTRFYLQKTELGDLPGWDRSVPYAELYSIGNAEGAYASAW